MGLSARDNNHFLSRVLSACEKNAAATVSMYEIGAGMGLSKEDSRHRAEELMADGLIEIRTLSGGIGLTPEGASLIRQRSGSAESEIKLGEERAISGAAKRRIDEILHQLHQVSAKNEELWADIRTLEAQMKSPSPKTEIIRFTLLDVAGLLKRCEQKAMSEQILFFCTN